MPNFDDLFSSPLTALGFGLLSDRQNPMGSALDMWQKGQQQKRLTENDGLDRQLKQAQISELSRKSDKADLEQRMLTSLFGLPMAGGASPANASALDAGGIAATPPVADANDIPSLEAKLDHLSKLQILAPEIAPLVNETKTKLERAYKLNDKNTDPPNEYQGKSSLFADRMSSAEPILDKYKDANTMKEKVLSNVPYVGNYLVNNDFQQLDQAKRNFINATLRQESGAAINESEFDNAEKQYFPQPGDKPDVIAQKAQNRSIAIHQMMSAAGPSFKRTGAATGSAGTPKASGGVKFLGFE